MISVNVRHETYQVALFKNMDGMRERDDLGQLGNKTAILAYGRAKHLIVANGSENLKSWGVAIAWP